MEDYRVRSRDGGYNRGKAGEYPREYQEYRNGGYNPERAGVYPREYREYSDGGHNREKAGAYPKEYQEYRNGGYNREKAGVYPKEYQEYRDGGHNREKARVSPKEYRDYRDGEYNPGKGGAYPKEYRDYRDGGYNNGRAGSYPEEYREYRDGSYNRENPGVYPKEYQEHRDNGYKREKAGIYPGEYRERKDGGYSRERAGMYPREEYREHTNHSEKGKNMFGFSPREHIVEKVVTKIEEYVYPTVVHKHERKVPPMEDDKHKGFRGKLEEKVFRGADQDEYRKERAKANPLKVSKWWKNDDLGNKVGHNYDDIDDLKSKEPPSMITDGGWERPNRTMWASPPGQKSDETISDALEYLKLEGAKTGNPGYRSTAAGPGRARPDDRTGRVSVPPNDLDRALDFLKETGVEATDKHGSRLTVGVPMRPRSDGYHVKPPVREADGYRGSTDNRETPRRHGGIRV